MTRARSISRAEAPACERYVTRRDSGVRKVLQTQGPIGAEDISDTSSMWTTSDVIINACGKYLGRGELMSLAGGSE